MWKKEQIVDFESTGLYSLAFAGMGLKKPDYVALFRKVERPEGAWMAFVDLIVGRWESSGRRQPLSLRIYITDRQSRAAPEALVGFIARAMRDGVEFGPDSREGSMSRRIYSFSRGVRSRSRIRTGRKCW